MVLAVEMAEALLMLVDVNGRYGSLEIVPKVVGTFLQRVKEMDMQIRRREGVSDEVAKWLRRGGLEWIRVESEVIVDRTPGTREVHQISHYR